MEKFDITDMVDRFMEEHNTDSLSFFPMSPDHIEDIKKVKNIIQDYVDAIDKSKIMKEKTVPHKRKWWELLATKSWDYIKVPAETTHEQYDMISSSLVNPMHRHLVPGSEVLAPKTLETLDAWKNKIPDFSDTHARTFVSVGMDLIKLPSVYHDLYLRTCSKPFQQVWRRDVCERRFRDGLIETWARAGCESPEDIKAFEQKYEKQANSLKSVAKMHSHAPVTHSGDKKNRKNCESSISDFKLQHDNPMEA